MGLDQAIRRSLVVIWSQVSSRVLYTLSLGVVIAIVARVGLLGAEGQQQPAPDELVKSVALEVLRAMREDPTLQGDSLRVTGLIQEKIVPHFDAERITRLAVGRAWRNASPAQRARLIDEFRTLLVRTYSTTFNAYSPVVSVRPLKVEPEEDDVRVKTLIKPADGSEPVSVDYSMFRSPGGWKVYDVTVDGVSLVTTYQSAFAEQVRLGEIEGLIKSLSTLNKARAALAPPRGRK